MASSTNRKSFTLSRKLEIIQAVENRGKKQLKAIAAEHQISASTLSTILKDKENIKNQCRGPLNRKKIKVSTKDQVDKALLAWLREKRSQNIPLSGQILQSKAEFCGAIWLSTTLEVQFWLVTSLETQKLPQKQKFGS